ncbi:receptor-like kinase TMK4 [Tanacetum coccineum]
MSYHSRHFLCLTITLLVLTAVKSDDGAVMTKLSHALTQTPSSWSTNTDYCKWEWITCDNSKRVKVISLADKKLFETLVPDLNELSQLKTLAVQRNSISGEVLVLSSLGNLQTMWKP